MILRVLPPLASINKALCIGTLLVIDFKGRNIDGWYDNTRSTYIHIIKAISDIHYHHTSLSIASLATLCVRSLHNITLNAALLHSVDGSIIGP